MIHAWLMQYGAARSMHLSLWNCGTFPTNSAAAIWTASLRASGSRWLNYGRRSAGHVRFCSGMPDGEAQGLEITPKVV
jgi:hypothetical protein